MVTVQCGTVTFLDVQAVIFDKDGTLADAAPYWRSLAQKRARLIDAQIPGVQAPLLMAFGAAENSWNPAGLMAVGTRHENAIAAAAYIAETGCSWREAVAIAEAAFAEADAWLPFHPSQTPLLADVRDLVMALHDHGVPLGLVSADTTDHVQAFLNHYALQSCITVGLGCEYGVKPDLGLLHEACDRLQVNAAAVLVIGDSAADMEMAHQAGAASIGVTWGGVAVSELTIAGAIANHPSEIRLSPTP